MEKVTKKRFGKVVAELLLVPLGPGRTTFESPAATPNLATPNAVRNDRTVSTLSMNSLDSTTGLSANIPHELWLRIYSYCMPRNEWFDVTTFRSSISTWVWRTMSGTSVLPSLLQVSRQVSKEGLHRLHDETTSGSSVWSFRCSLGNGMTMMLGAGFRAYTTTSHYRTSFQCLDEPPNRH